MMLVRILFLVAMVIGHSSAIRAGETAVWVRTGLEWHNPIREESAVDQARVAAQIEAGCVETGIRFGDTAAMRDTLGPIDWPEAVRKLVSAAALLDRNDAAQSLLDQAAAVPGLDRLMIAALENQRILTALQFGDIELADRLLDRFGIAENLPGPIRADRLFWSVLIEAPKATSADWRTALGPRLDAALAADPYSFQTRVYRLIAWLEGDGWTAGTSCMVMIGKYSALALDISEASACPLMIGHVTHALDRHFKERADDPDAGSLGIWRTFATGVLAIVAGERDTAVMARNRLANPLATIPCADQMAKEILMLERLR